MISGIGSVIIILALTSYAFYSKYAETKQIEAVSRIDNISYKEVSDLIDKIKK